MQLKNLRDNVESQAKPTDVGFRRDSFKTLEDPLLILGRDADTFVSDRKHHVGAFSVSANMNRLAGGELGGIRQKVYKDLLDAEVVPPNLEAALHVNHHVATSLFKLTGETLEDVMEEVFQHEFLQLDLKFALTDAGDVEEIFNQLGQPSDMLLGGVEDLGEVPFLNLL